MILKVSKIYLFVLLNMEYKESYQRRLKKKSNVKIIAEIVMPIKSDLK